MKKNIKIEEHEDGTKTTTTIITTTPEDGFVPDTAVQSDAIYNHGKYHKGYSANVHVETDDPRVSRLFIILMAIFFIFIVIFVCSKKVDASSIIIGGFSIIYVLIILVAALKQINKKEKELMAKDPSYDPKDTQPIKDFSKEVVNGYKEAKKQSRLHYNRKKILLIAVPIYIIITLVVSLLSGYLFGSPAGYSMLAYIIFFDLFTLIIFLIFF